MTERALPVIIDRPGPDCSRPPDERLCVATSGCGHALTPRLGLGDYHYTRCALDGGAEHLAPLAPISDPPASGPRLIQKLAQVIPLRKSPFKMKLCNDPFAQLPPSPVEPRLARWKAIVGRPRVRRLRVLAEAPKRARRRCLRPAWRMGWICPETSCRYHLSDLGGAPLAPGCALIVASGGPRTLESIATLTGSSRQNIQQTMERALDRKGLRRLREFAPDDTGTVRHQLTADERVQRLLSAGAATTAELSDGTGMDVDRVRRALRRLEAAGRVMCAPIGAADAAGLEWSNVEHGSDADNTRPNGVGAWLGSENAPRVPLETATPRVDKTRGVEQQRGV